MKCKTTFVFIVLILVLLLADTCQAAKKRKKSKGKDCRARPCKNGGTCLERRGKFRCSCPDGFKGKRCQKGSGQRSDTQAIAPKLCPFAKECMILRRGICMTEEDAKNAGCKKFTNDCGNFGCVCCISPVQKCSIDTTCEDRGGSCITEETAAMKCVDKDDRLCDREMGCFCCIRSKEGEEIIDRKEQFGSEFEKVEKLRSSWLEKMGSFIPDPAQQQFLTQMAEGLLNQVESKSGREKRQITPICVRQEYRTLSKTQREAFHAALEQAMLTAVTPGVSQYQLMIILHQASFSPGAHGGPAFHGWHRILLLIFEFILKTHDSTVCLPYWDSTLDAVLPVPRDSILFSHKLMGTASGLVTYGDFAYWPVIQNCLPQGYTLTRGFSQSGNLLYSDSFVNNICLYSQWSLEGFHVGPHVFIGGHMAAYGIICAPADPIFFMHHAFADYIWQNWRACPGNAFFYPPASPPHGAFDPMLPFGPLLNIHGLWPWNPWFYTYAPRPQTCTVNSDCDPRRLWCDTSAGPAGPYFCKAKVKLGGSCPPSTISTTTACECGECNAALVCQIVTVAQAVDCMSV